MERVKGIEPSSVAWEATALPLSYTRLVPGNSMRPGRQKATGGVAPPVPVHQKLPLNCAKMVASRALFCAAVVLMPMLLFRPNISMRTPMMAVT